MCVASVLWSASPLLGKISGMKNVLDWEALRRISHAFGFACLFFFSFTQHF